MSDKGLDRVLIIGAGGVGKTTLGKNLCKKLNITHIDIDDLYFKPNTNLSVNFNYSALEREAANEDRWIISGCARDDDARERLFLRADSVIWLDYNAGVNFYQVSKRAVERFIKKDKKVMSDRGAFVKRVGKTSTGWFERLKRKKREYSALFNELADKYPNVKYAAHSTNRRQTRKIVKTLVNNG